MKFSIFHQQNQKTPYKVFMGMNNLMIDLCKYLGGGGLASTVFNILFADSKEHSNMFHSCPFSVNGPRIFLKIRLKYVSITRDICMWRTLQWMMLASHLSFRLGATGCNQNYSQKTIILSKLYSKETDSFEWSQGHLLQQTKIDGEIYYWIIK